MNSGGLVQKNPANITSGKHIQNYSTFDKSLSYRKYNTLRFAEYTPSFEMEGVERDEISLNSSDRIDSLSLNAPFKGTIRKVKESFKVPYMALLPMNWDRIYTQPSNGDDVPQNANCYISTFPKLFFDLFFSAIDGTRASILDGSAPTSAYIQGLVRSLLLGEYVYSAGSLLNVCGYKSLRHIQIVRLLEDIDYDAYFDKVISFVFSRISSFQVSFLEGSTFNTLYFNGLGSSSNGAYLPFRLFLDMARTNPRFNISSNFLVFEDSESVFNSELRTAFSSGGDLNYTFVFRGPSMVDDRLSDDVTELQPSTLNLSRILAYQMICAHFYTNSSLDIVYSAELYRQYIKLLYDSMYSGSPNPSFSWNGIDCPYDYLSGLRLSRMLVLDSNNAPFVFGVGDLINDVTQNPDTFSYRLASFAAIFAYRKSLRFGDYFTASRPRPLAPINTDVAVNNNAVSVIDITRGIQAQRFANSVMRTRQKIEDYVEGLFGRKPAPDFHNPFFLTRQEEIIFGDEVQNTAETQATDANSRTANFASNVGRYTFTFNNDDMHPCIYMQIISFDVRRAYTGSVDRHFLHRDRFDMFNPDFQYIGDQPIYGVELGYIDKSLNRVPRVFAYTSRDMEYKQRFDVASGGFVKNLPGWAMLDSDKAMLNTPNLTPEFIRSNNSELDRFFLSLTGYSLGSYFHFICITDNNVSAKRAMAVDPQILA